MALTHILASYHILGHAAMLCNARLVFSTSGTQSLHNISRYCHWVCLKIGYPKIHQNPKSIKIHQQNPMVETSFCPSETLQPWGKISPRAIPPSTPKDMVGRPGSEAPVLPQKVSWKVRDPVPMSKSLYIYTRICVYGMYVMWCDVMWCNVMWCDVMYCDIM